VNFELAPELRLFRETVRTAIGGWEPLAEPELGEWLDDRDDELAARLTACGWSELWTAEHGPVVAGAFELGRATAPVCLLDEVTLGAPLAIGGRVRHGVAASACAVPQPGWGLALARPGEGRTREPTLDGMGTVLVTLGELEALAPDEAEARWSAWAAATLSYLAGLANASFEAALEHARAREQFGRPLSAMPAVQARLADAALARDGMFLTSWSPTERSLRTAALLWAGSACRDITASVHQVHGAVGFALETGLHRYYRRAKAVQVWTAAVCDACA
jgi:Acyl-CoA dehydrogenase, C-terminal domain